METSERTLEGLISAIATELCGSVISPAILEKTQNELIAATQHVREQLVQSIKTGNVIETAALMVPCVQAIGENAATSLMVVAKHAIFHRHPEHLEKVLP